MSKGNNTAEKDVAARLIEARGIIDECVQALSKGKGRKLKSVPAKAANPKPTGFAKLDFTLNQRNFIKTYAKGLSGPKKFTLLLAYNTKGKIGTKIELSKVRSMWNKMTSKNLMGYAFNLNYPTEAKTNGCIDSTKAGVYYLHQGWMNIFN